MEQKTKKNTNKLLKIDKKYYLLISLFLGLIIGLIVLYMIINLEIKRINQELTQLKEQNLPEIINLSTDKTIITSDVPIPFSENNLDEIKSTQIQSLSTTSKLSEINQCSPICNTEKIGLPVNEIFYNNRKILKIGSGTKSLLIFHGTNGISCNFAWRNHELIEKALNKKFSVYIFQGECPYCDKMQFSVDTDYDLNMVKYIIESEELTDVYLYGFSQGAVFSMFILDNLNIKGAVIDSGTHPDQLERTCSPNFIDKTVNIQGQGKILLICGEKDQKFCLAQDKIFADNVKKKVIPGSGHEPHTDVKNIFEWALSE